MVEGLLFNGSPANFPNSYGELKAGVYQKIFEEWNLEKPVEERDYFQLFDILCSNSRKPFKGVERKPENEEAIYLLTRWVVETPADLPKALPAEMKVAGTSVAIPSKINHLSIGQNIVMKQLIGKAKYLEQCLTMAVAVYLQPIIDGTKFNMARAKEVEAVVAEMPIVDVYPVGFFLLTHAMRFGRKPLNGWQQILNSLSMKLKLMLLLWQKPSGLQGLRIYH